MRRKCCQSWRHTMSSEQTKNGSFRNKRTLQRECESAHPSCYYYTDGAWIKEGEKRSEQRTKSKQIIDPLCRKRHTSIGVYAERHETAHHTVFCESNRATVPRKHLSV